MYLHILCFDVVHCRFVLGSTVIHTYRSKLCINFFCLVDWQKSICHRVVNITVTRWRREVCIGTNGTGDVHRQGTNQDALYLATRVRTIRRMAGTLQASKNKITLRGSTDIVAEFFSLYFVEVTLVLTQIFFVSILLLTRSILLFISNIAHIPRLIIKIILYRLRLFNSLKDIIMSVIAQPDYRLLNRYRPTRVQRG